jgi:ACDE family multidrug resistance protein
MAETKVYRERNFLIASISSCLMMMMVVVISPAFPMIIRAFDIPEQSIGLVITAYTIPYIVLTPLAGIMADRMGRKRVLVPALFAFGIFGAACALATDFNTLVLFRVLQGIGGAPVGSISVAIIGDLFTGRKRAEAMGLFTTINYIGYIIFPLMGGALAGLSWNYAFLPFLLGIPLAIIALLYLDCPELESKQTMKVYLGDTFNYLKSYKVLWIFLSLVVAYVILYGGYLTYFGILLGSRFQASSFTIGLFISILGLVTATTSAIVGRLSRRFTSVTLIMAGFVIYSVSLVIIPAVPNIWLFLLPVVVFGIAHGLILPSENVIAASVAPTENRAGFMAINSTMRTVGMTIAPLVVGLAFTLTGLDFTFIACGILALIIPLAALMIGKKRLS